MPFYVTCIRFEFVKSPEVTLRGWLGYAPSINKLMLLVQHQGARGRVCRETPEVADQPTSSQQVGRCWGHMTGRVEWSVGDPCMMATLFAHISHVPHLAANCIDVHHNCSTHFHWDWCMCILFQASINRWFRPAMRVAKLFLDAVAKSLGLLHVPWESVSTHHIQCWAILGYSWDTLTDWVILS